MTTPGKSRQSGIPAPGRSSGIPTPGRPRSSSNIYQRANASEEDDISRAFADAIKANDPAQHRTIPNSSVAASLSPTTGLGLPPSGRRSVAGRSPSVASASSSNYSAPNERSKTPTFVRPPSRPPSRHSDVFINKVVSRPFEVGDNVRIESLGYEGTLRYVGEIDGKVGLWAGVELSGGFSGKGKNNGSVNGKQYFICPEKCGVFVATTKLSAPTVGLGAISRPSSVASSRGRMTPSITGRVTPSFSSSASRTSFNGRTTPASGRITPSTSTGRITPAVTPANSRIRGVSKPMSTTTSPSLPNNVTAGSRASKYASMTAKQLSSRDIDAERKVEYHHTNLVPSPSYSSRALSSPTRSTASPFSTPKPGLGNRVPRNISSGPSSPVGKARPSANTPRARIPSSAAMPPPASPVSAVARSAPYIKPLHEREDSIVSLTELQTNGKILQERISHLVSPSVDSPSRPHSSSSVSSGGEDRELVEQLESRLRALEYENDRLRMASANEVTSEVVPVEPLRLELDEANGHISKLTHLLSEQEEVLEMRDKKIASLEQKCTTISGCLEVEKSSKESDIRVLHKKLEECDGIIQSLQETVQSSDVFIVERNTLLEAKETELNILQSRLDDACGNFEEERRDLGLQIDELRVAGQETIALYEERLSKADAQRYDLETRLSAFEGAKVSDRTQSPRSSGYITSAQEIDNETLRDQVIHFQKKIATMEDILEDVRATSEREEAILRDKMKRLKDKEDSMKKELNEGRAEVERMAKSEASAKNRVEEAEEALRESTLALENARADVETLRAELANLDGLIGDGIGDLSSRVSSFVHRAVTDKAKLEGMINLLQNQLEEAKKKSEGHITQLTTERSDELKLTVSKLTKQNEELLGKNDGLQKRLEDTMRNMDNALEELDSMKKGIDCSSTVTNGMQGSLKPSLSKQELSLAREEITGLKHIVQELQKENLSSMQRIKLLESENQLLSSEVSQLREEVKVLEENLDHSLSEESDRIKQASEPLSVESTSSTDELLKEQKSRFENELEHVRKRLAEVEMKHARTVHDLNKEIGELEALVESKIYREDELEQEIERLKEKITRQKKSSKNSGEVNESRQRLSTTSLSSTASSETVCEICERPGHDIFNCDLLKEDTPIGSTREKLTSSSGELFCEDCESHGHMAADCPHSLDVF
ncbi:hypothetical protein BDQ17DRAFT_1312094 [Cyathus striatus]|nr:hypothetical protein BDQ17DRAFT_1312094 [Cyathus striatus]